MICICGLLANGIDSGLSARAEPVVLQAVSFQPRSVSFAVHFFRLVDSANRRCAPTLEIRASGPQTIPSELQWHAMMTGEVDIYYGPASYYRGLLPHGDVLSLAHTTPAEQRSNGSWDLLNRLHNQTVNAWYLTSLAAGVRFYLYTREPLTKGRLDGMRIRSVPLYEGFVRSMGGVPVFMPAPSVAAALEQKVVDGYGWPGWSAGLGWEAHVTHRYGPGFLNAASPVLVNLDRWNRLDDTQRDCLTAVARWVEDQWPIWKREEDARQDAARAAAGIIHVDLGPEFAEKAETLVWRMLETAEPAFVAKVRPLMAPR